MQSTKCAALVATKLINAKAFKQYPLNLFTLIPLHPYTQIRKDKKGRERKVGKAPRDFNWTQTKYDSKGVIAEAIKNNHNVGVRLEPDQLVIDIDPRNGGTEGFASLCDDLVLDPKTFPCVRTGSGGYHYYLTKPDDVPIKDTLQKYSGVEFKSKGRQVVAAGSRHPNGELYAWVAGHPDIKDAPPVDPDLLKLIARPQRDSTVTGGGQYTPLQLAHALTGLDPEDFREHATWLKLAMSCHHATAGDARHEFIEWSTLDPKYVDDAEIIGRRWDSFHTERDQAVTFRTLNKFLADAGKADLQVAPDASEDFADDLGDTPDETDWLEGGSLDDEEPLLEKLNEKYCAVFGNGQYRIMYREPLRWSTASKQDFLSRFENQFVENGAPGRGQSKVIPLGKAWQQWPGRKTADGTTFDTRAEPASIVNGALNLWSGFAIQPKKGRCERFKAMIHNDLCDGNREVYSYVMKWIAWKLQHPGELPEVSLNFIGPKGTGKTTLGETVAGIFGEHGMCADHIDKIAGRFNGHLETKCFVYADEAVWGGDHRTESALKKLITDKEATYEYKGVQLFTGQNHVGVISAGNAEWMVPASMDERRFCVSRTSSKHVVPQDAPMDHPNRIYWSKVYSELNSGGREAFLYEMLDMTLGDWHPRIGVPKTEALAEQKQRGLTGVARWYHDMLRDGDVVVEVVEGTNSVWSKGDLHLQPSSVVKSYAAWIQSINPRASVGTVHVLTELKNFGCDGGEHCRERRPTRDRYWFVPRLDKARAIFCEKIGFNVFEGGE